MASTFFGLEMGRRSLQTQQTALNVTGHNIANANTEGYSRQRAIMTTTDPYTVPGYYKPIGAGQVGTGVMVQEIGRLRDTFIDTQLRKEANSLAEWEAKQNSLQKIEVIFNEPSDSGLRTVLEQFWAGWQELSKKPEEESARSIVRQRGIALAETLNHLDRQFTDLAKDLDSSIRAQADNINNIASQIASLNSQISRVESQGDHANDLRDKRDLLVDNLSKLARISVSEDENGMINITINGRALVMNSKSFEVVAVSNASNNFYADLQWKDDNAAVVLTAGSVKGMLDMRDTYIDDYRGKLDNIANALVIEINSVHSAGYGLNAAIPAGNFFDSAETTAATISVDASIIASLDNIAAATNPTSPGDGSNALDIAQLNQQALIGAATIDDYYRGVITQLGVQSQESTRMADNQNLLVAQLENNRQQVSGVSLDEEMSNMIKFQHAYNAAARVVTAVDEMIDTIVNRLGIVGR